MSDPINVPPVMVTLEAAKLHLRVDTDDEDTLIETIVLAAYRAIEGKIFRAIYPDALAAADDPTGLVVDHDINVAVLLLVGHLYANREAVSAAGTVEMPMGVEWMIVGYRDCAAGY